MSDEQASFKKLIDIGIALSAEQDPKRLMERILIEAKSMTRADGGTLYIRTEDDKLRFEIMRTDSLNIVLGGTTGKEITFPPLNLYDPETGEENRKNVASYAALTGRSINIPDAYEEEGFDFSGTKKFDEGT
ncbi:MAG: diguanylate cyclase, partial [Alphaproteobacteria bacterium]|nr:diguanylate cyclase [Alphaproteobacteria bacterium]